MMTLDDPEASRGQTSDTLHGNHGSTADDAAEIADSRSPNRTPAGDSDSKHRHRRLRPARHGHYYNSLHPFMFVPNEALFHEPLQHRLHRHRDHQQGSDLRPHGPSQRRHRRPHRPRHGRNHKSAGKNQAMTSPEVAVSPLSPSTSEHKDGDNNIGSGLDSSLVGGAEGGDNLGIADQFPFVCRREHITFDDVRKERERRKKLEESNRDSLSTLAALSIEFARRLDATYYSLLDTVTSLQCAITSFQDLTNLASVAQTEFNRESSSLEGEHRKQIIEFNDFQRQVRRVETLEGRMQWGREKALALDKRLESVREKIEAWDQREGEWQAQVTRRLRILWGFMGTIALAFAVVRFVGLIRPVPLSDTPDTTWNISPSIALSQNLSSMAASYSSVPESLQDLDKLNSLLGFVPSEDGEEDHCKVDAEPAPQATATGLQQNPEEPLQRVIDEL